MIWAGRIYRGRFFTSVSNVVPRLLQFLLQKELQKEV
jgi:hypothetical protein